MKGYVLSEFLEIFIMYVEKVWIVFLRSLLTVMSRLYGQNYSSYFYISKKFKQLTKHILT